MEFVTGACARPTRAEKMATMAIAGKMIVNLFTHAKVIKTRAPGKGIQEDRCAAHSN
jgi:hypothetical protein